MPDISMCMGTGCERAAECYRYRAKPNPYRQSYFGRPPMDEQGDCGYFWQIEEGDILDGGSDEADRD